MKPSRISTEVKRKSLPPSVRTVDFGRVLTCTPINADAARAASQKGEHYTRSWAGTEVALLSPANSKPVPDSVADLRGVQFGRFTVVGYFAKKRWVVRCHCGTYTVRGTKAIKNPANSEDRCEDCRDTFFKREGRLPNGARYNPDNDKGVS